MRLCQKGAQLGTAFFYKAVKECIIQPDEVSPMCASRLY